MDEPLSNLDAKLRVQTRNQIAGLQRRLGTTTVYVTHDQVEAMTMGDRVAVLRDGVLQQCAAPRELYRSPVNMFVAEFIGSPAMNLFTLPVVDHSVALGDWPIPLPREITGTTAELVVGIRPEHLDSAARGVEMQIDVVEELGADAYLYGRIARPDNAFESADRRACRRAGPAAAGQSRAPTSATGAPAFLRRRRSSIALVHGGLLGNRGCHLIGYLTGDVGRVAVLADLGGQ